MSPRQAQQAMFPIPTELDDPKFLRWWERWLTDRKKRGKPVTEYAQELQLAKLLDYSKKGGLDAAILAVQQAIESGWATFYWPKTVESKPLFAEKAKCERCNGRRFVLNRELYDKTGDFEWAECPGCGGTGVVAP